MWRRRSETPTAIATTNCIYKSNMSYLFYYGQVTTLAVLKWPDRDPTAGEFARESDALPAGLIRASIFYSDRMKFCNILRAYSEGVGLVEK